MRSTAHRQRASVVFRLSSSARSMESWRMYLTRPYVSNSFHCHVTEDITPIEKQDLEGRFWELCNGGKIQYVRYPIGLQQRSHPHPDPQSDGPGLL